MAPCLREAVEAGADANEDTAICSGELAETEAFLGAGGYILQLGPHIFWGFELIGHEVKVADVERAVAPGGV